MPYPEPTIDANTDSAQGQSPTHWEDLGAPPKVRGSLSSSEMLYSERYLIMTMNDQLNCLQDSLGKALQNGEGLQRVARIILNALQAYTRAAHVSFVLCTKQPTVSRLQEKEGETQNEIIRSRVLGHDEDVNLHLLRPVSDDKLVQSIFDETTTQIFPNFDEKRPQYWEVLPSTGNIKSWIAMPLIWFGQEVGLITLSHGKAGQFAGVDVDVLKKY